MGDSTIEPGAPAGVGPLDYAPADSAARRWARGARRWWPVAVLLAVAAVGLVYGPHACRHVRLMRLQAACLDADLPRDRPVLEWNPAAARALVAERPQEYKLSVDCTEASRVDPRWAVLRDELRLGRLSDSPGPAAATLFLHERLTPAGRRRLVVLEELWVTIIEPGTWTGSRPRVVGRGRIERGPALADALRPLKGAEPDGRSMAGVPDPRDASRFTVTAVWHGVPATLEYRLGDDDDVTERLLDPEGVSARARAVAAERVGRTR